MAWATSRTIVEVAGEVTSRPSAPRLGPWCGRAGLAAATAFVVAGFALEVGDKPAAAAVGAVVALGAATALFLTTSRLWPLYAGAGAAGVALMTQGNPANVGWFALCLVAGWCALLAGPVGGGGALGVALVLYAAEWVFAVHDVGWGRGRRGRR